MSGTDDAGSFMTQVRSPQAPVREQVFSQIVASIESGRLQAGQPLVERLLVEQSGASRTAVREALRQLETQGLVRREGVRLVVAGLRPDEAREIYEVRAALEGIAAAACAESADQETRDQLAAVLETYIDIARRNDIEQALATKERLYALVYAGAQTGIVEDLMRTLNIRIRHLRSATLHLPGRLEQSADEMRALVGAITVGDAEAARRAAANHVRAAASNLRALTSTSTD